MIIIIYSSLSLSLSFFFFLVYMSRRARVFSIGILLLLFSGIPVLPLLGLSIYCFGLGRILPTPVRVLISFNDLVLVGVSKRKFTAISDKCVRLWILKTQQ